VARRLDPLISVFQRLAVPSIIDRIVRSLWRRPFARPSFTFHDPSPLVDRELELVAPNLENLDLLLESANHPDTLAGGEPGLTRERACDFLATAPAGHEIPRQGSGRPPTYHFWMKVRAVPGYAPPFSIVGGIGLRVGDTDDLRMYLGHIGYHVHAPARGRHFAARSVRLLLPLAKRHGLRELWITSNPENVASRRSIERAGGTYVHTVQLPPNHPLALGGEPEKCRYRFDL